LIIAINHIAILGLGLIGGSYAKALRNSSKNLTISAYDTPEVLNSAFKDDVIDIRLNSIEEALEADLIILCLPLGINLAAFRKLIPNLKDDQIITDVSGIKLPFQKIWESSASKGIYIGGHPMTGKENGGYENSDPLLFENSVYILAEDIAEVRKYENFREIVESLGVNILFIPPKQHDIIAASVSHLPQLIAVTLVNTASLKTDEYNFLDLAAGGFRDLTRIASSDFNIWDEVINENKTQIITAIEEFLYELNSLKKWIINSDSEKLHNYFEDARRSRDEIPKNSKGFLTPVHDIYIFVKDEPGVISRISTKLFDAGINIKDIELLKVREGSGGTFRLSFSSKSVADEAKELLSDLGFQFRE
jgi:prephenate dehydrogenase